MASKSNDISNNNDNNNDSPPSNATAPPNQLTERITPHTLRLIKLITTSTQSSSPHTRQAIALLSKVSSTCHPIVLWDILARLYSSLTKDEVQLNVNAKGADGIARRESVALAMEFVAKCLPVVDRQSFLREEHDRSSTGTRSSGDSNSGSDSSAVKEDFEWLSVLDFLPTQQQNCSTSENEMGNNNHDNSKGWESLDAVLEKGRLLLSSTGTNYLFDSSTSQEYQREGELLKDLDSLHHDNDDDNNFIEERMRMQRRILAQRLGLSGVLSSSIVGQQDLLAEDFVKDSDLMGDCLEGTNKRDNSKTNCSNTTTTRQTSSVPRQKRRRTQETQNDTDDSNPPCLFLRALHVKKSTTATTGAKCTIHKNPQTVLANDLIFNTFHPCWNVRHGSLLGLLSLLKSWKCIRTRENSLRCKEEKEPFGKWPQDILARCICILALDRFGDYSGASIISMMNLDSTMEDENGSIQGGESVAPVRETAAQVISLLLSMSPVESIQRQSCQVLERLVGYEREWEVRHGAMLVFKYVVAIGITPCWDIIPGVAIDGLGDSNDDVRGASAQVLTCLLVKLRTEMSNERSGIWKMTAQECIPRYLKPLWDAMKVLHSASSCAFDLLELFTRSISVSCNTVLGTMMTWGTDTVDENRTMKQLLETLNRFLTFDSLPVRLCCLRSLRHIVAPIISTYSFTGKSGEVGHECLSQRRDSDMVSVFCSLLSTLFDSFFDLTSMFDEEAKFQNNDDSISPQESKNKILLETRCKAWETLIQSLPALLNGPYIDEKGKRIWLLTAVNMLLKLVGMTPSMTCDNSPHSIGVTQHMLRSRISYYFTSFSNASKALAQLFDSVMDREIQAILSTALTSLLQSPWPEKCEQACIIIKSIALLQNKERLQRSAPVLQDCGHLLINALTLQPNCLAINSFENVEKVRSESVTKALCDSIFVGILEKMIERNRSDDFVCYRDASSKIVQVWSQTFKSHGIDIAHRKYPSKNFSSSLVSMRLTTSIAEAIVFIGEGSYPAKLTPMVRAIMTSIKSEQTPARSKSAVESLLHMVETLANLKNNCSKVSATTGEKVRHKILNNICLMACIDIEEHLPVGMSTQGSIAAKAMLQLLVSKMPKSQRLDTILPLWERVHQLSSSDPATFKETEINASVHLLNCISGNFREESLTHHHVIDKLLPTSSLLACTYHSCTIRARATEAVTNISMLEPEKCLPTILPIIFEYLQKMDNDSERLGACTLLYSLVKKLGVSIFRFVRVLLPVAMSMMTDPLQSCANLSASTFARLVRVAPLVPKDENNQFDMSHYLTACQTSDKVIDHLIHGESLPPCHLPETINASLKKRDIILRDYQKEGVAWINFLRSVRLNGALCDDMGLGKTLQALVGISMAHKQDTISKSHKSLIVCPASIVGHWMKEIEKIGFKQCGLNPLQYTGTADSRSAKLRLLKEHGLVVTSYSVLRADVEKLKTISWTYCILDEGHLMKNPKTATARAARMLKARHKLLLSGTPVQNRVHELWAVFDWLLPNYLGSESDFAKCYGRDITRGHLPGASPTDIRNGMEKLKSLHQQVLPFILRREKGSVLMELPPKTVTDIPCNMTSHQTRLYTQICESHESKGAMGILQRYLDRLEKNDSACNLEDIARGGKNVLKSLSKLRMICTHPSLLNKSKYGKLQNPDFQRFDLSGKLLALNDLLRASQIYHDDFAAVDNDQSLIYIGNEGAESNEGEIFDVNDDDVCEMNGKKNEGSKCLIFAQFTSSLDCIEDLLFKPHMPSLQYLRLDGTVLPEDRTFIVDQFHTDESIKCMLLTTKVGGLGLNLQIADTVIFLECDWNPHVDLQAMDRAHRIGQTKNVNVYRLITTNSIEEKIMQMQAVKLSISDAIVNSNNSTMFSMGTDRLLDLFSADIEHL